MNMHNQNINEPLSPSLLSLLFEIQNTGQVSQYEWSHLQTVLIHQMTYMIDMHLNDIPVNDVMVLETIVMSRKEDLVLKLKAYTEYDINVYFHDKKEHAIFE